MNKALATLLVLLGTASLALSQSSRLPPVASNYNDFLIFKSKYGKKYSGSIEENYRLNIFIYNKLNIDLHNSNPANTYKKEVN